MNTVEEILDKARKTLGKESRINLHVTPVEMTYEDGVLTVEGELEDVAAKKLALERLAAITSVTGIIDRLHVKPAQHMGDGEIRDLVRDALLQERSLANIALYEVVKGEPLLVRDPPGGSQGTITLRVNEGIVTLDGDVPGLAQKRLAGVLAWWVPGSRDVINGLGVTPPEEDNDEEISESVRIVLEKDPFVEATQIRVQTRNSIVELEGLVPTDSERDMAEFDAWYVFGVDKVINHIQVRH